MTARYVPLDIDSEPVRLARDLKTFIQHAAARPFGKARAKVSSTDWILAPVATFAVNRLRRELRRMKVRVAEAVWRDLRQNISERLSFALTPTLRFHEELAKTVARGLNLTGSRRNDITLLESFAEFPDLLDTGTRLISSWIAAQLELFTRLFADMEFLSTVFFSRERPLRVVRIHAGLSDPHDGGRTVTMIQFAGRLRVIYKPRRCDGELFWFQALRWLDRTGIHADFRAPKILARKEHFWMEFLRTSTCRTSAAVHRFYFRWGAQAGLAQVLRASDLHRENWLAVGPQPILLDAEMLGDADIPIRQKGQILDRQSLSSLLQTGMLPLTSRDQVGLYRGIAPLDATINKTRPIHCWPRFKGRFQPPSKYINELTRGFEAVATVFATRQSARQFFREIILPADANKRRRILLRSTSRYMRLLHESLEPRNMIFQGARWRWLAQECLRSAASRPIGLGEACALLRCDIPKFTKPSERFPISRQQFLTAIADLKRSSRLFRCRVLLGKHREKNERIGARLKAAS